MFPFAVVIFGSMALFWDLPALPCAYMESLRQGEQQRDPPRVQNRAGRGVAVEVGCKVACKGSSGNGQAKAA